MKKIAILLFITLSFVFAQNTYVPDDKFEQALIDLGYDTTLDDSVLTANISGVTTLDVSDKEISDLTGIEAFTALVTLDMSENELTSIDVSKNTALVYLELVFNDLTSIDVSKNTALVTLDMSENKLTSIDVSKNTALVTLMLWDNELTSIDVSNNTALVYLVLDFNDLTSIDVSKNTALEELKLWANELTSIDVSKNTALQLLDMDGNQLTSLDLSKNIALTVLFSTSNQLTSLDLSKNTALMSFYVGSNQLTSLDLSNGLTDQITDFEATYNFGLICIKTLDPVYATANWNSYIDEGVTFSLSCSLADFEWVSTVSDTINITESNLADTYTLQWGSSNDGFSVNYLIYGAIGVNPTEEISMITSLSVPISYQEILETAFEGVPGNALTVRFNVKATNGVDTVNVTGDNRVLYVNRYDYLSVEGEGIPTEFALHENYPNPFNPNTTLRFDLPEASNITLTIFNMLGQKIRTYDMQSAAAGYHTLKWNATNDYGDPVGAGVYLYQLQAKDFVKTRKMVLLK